MKQMTWEFIGQNVPNRVIIRLANEEMKDPGRYSGRMGEMSVSDIANETEINGWGVHPVIAERMRFRVEPVRYGLNGSFFPTVPEVTVLCYIPEGAVYKSIEVTKRGTELRAEPRYNVVP
jgi:hypothetical protein